MLRPNREGDGRFGRELGAFSEQSRELVGRELLAQECSHAIVPGHLIELATEAVSGQRRLKRDLRVSITRN